MKSLSIAVIALLGYASAVKLTRDAGVAQPFGSPYQLSEEMQSKLEVEEAREIAGVADLRTRQHMKEVERKREDQKKLEEWNKDIRNPAHNQGRKFQIIEDKLLVQEGDEPTIQEDDFMSDKLFKAKAESADQEAKK